MVLKEEIWKCERIEDIKEMDAEFRRKHVGILYFLWIHV